MIQTRKLFAMAGLTLLAALAGCGGNKSQVMRGENNTFTVIGSGENETKALEQALDKANSYCDDENKKAVFVDEKKEYQGALPESVNRTIAKVPGVKKVVSSEDDYKVTLKARCE